MQNLDDVPFEKIVDLMVGVGSEPNKANSMLAKQLLTCGQSRLSWW